MIVMKREKYSQGERIAYMIHFLVTEGSKSYPELKKRFPMFSEATLLRDVELLMKTELIIEKPETRQINGISTRKIFIFFKDDKDVVGKTKKAMNDLKDEFYGQVTLDLIASRVGLPPETIRDAAYTLAPEVGLLIGMENIKDTKRYTNSLR